MSRVISPGGQRPLEPACPASAPAVRVRARFVWSEDGEETIEGSSDAYAGRLVLVHTHDLRLYVRSVWLDVDDVERVTPRAAVAPTPQAVARRPTSR